MTRGWLAHLVDVLKVHQLLGLQPGVLAPVAALGAVVAVLWASARLDAQQRAALDLRPGKRSETYHRTRGEA
jgi:hypothetical protein